MVLLIIIGMSIISIGIVAFAVMAFEQHKKQKQIYVDLGLEKSFSGEERTPFFKWGWRKKTQERVWAERIVQEAFGKAKIWLSADDLTYFQRLCNEHENNKTINIEKVKGKVASICGRMDAIRGAVSQRVETLLQSISSTSENDAKRILEHHGMYPDSGNVLVKYGTYRLRNDLVEIGKEILGYQALGIPITGVNREVLHHLRGMPSWRLWLRIYKEEIYQTTGKQSLSRPSLMHALQKNVESGLFLDYEKDAEAAGTFRKSVEREIERKELKIKPEDIERVESIMYTWRFTQKISFNHVDQRHMRVLLCNKELAWHFREVLFASISLKFESMKDMVSQFPRRVFFFGKNASARRFASEQYSAHLTNLIKSAAAAAGMDSEPPEIITIDEGAFSSKMNEADEKLAEMSKYTEKRGFKTTDEIRDVSYIVNIIESEKAPLNRERSLTYDNGERKGWIISIPISDETPDAYRALDEEIYHEYHRFNCDIMGDIDLKSTAYQAKQQRIIFFNMLIDVLTGRAELEMAKSNAESFAAAV